VWPSTLGLVWPSPGQTSQDSQKGSWVDCTFYRRRPVRWFPPWGRHAQNWNSWAVHCEDLGVRRRCNRRVHPGVGYPAGLRRVGGRRTPCAMTGPRRGASEKCLRRRC
jgi:hypothetical protein